MHMNLLENLIDKSWSLNYETVNGQKSDDVRLPWQSNSVHDIHLIPILYSFFTVPRIYFLSWDKNL